MSSSLDLKTSKTFALIVDRMREIELIINLGLDLSDIEKKELLNTLSQLKDTLTD